MKIRFRRDGQVLGEHEEETISTLLNLKVILPTDEFWNENTSRWEIVSSTTVVVPEVPSDLDDGSPSTKTIRIIGCSLLTLGGLLLWLCVLDPIQEASRHAGSVSFSFKGIFMVPAFLIVGVLGAVAPSFVPHLFQSPDGGNGRKVAAAGIFLLAGGILYTIVRAKLRSLGYG